MNQFGGYFELELNRGREYHDYCLRLNSGRNALEYILKKRKYTKVHIPYYTCEVMLQPLRRAGVRHEFYPIDEWLLPIFDYDKLEPREAVVITNYFGLLDESVSSLAASYRDVIVDNSQAFFARPPQGCDTFYSPRKFFGIPDGAYLYLAAGGGEDELYESLPQDISYERFDHLLMRADNQLEIGYQEFCRQKSVFADLPLRKMSAITQRMLDSIDYDGVRETRCENFQSVHTALRAYNKLKLNFSRGEYSCPLAYPLLTDDKGLRSRLIKAGVFIPQYWSNVLGWAKVGSFESYLAQNLVAVPIDQRYNGRQVQKMLKIIVDDLGLT